MPHDPSYRNIDEKVQDAERYLIRRVDSIRRLVLVAVLLGVVAVGTSLWTLLGTGRTDPRRSPPSVEEARSAP